MISNKKVLKVFFIFSMLLTGLNLTAQSDVLFTSLDSNCPDVKLEVYVDSTFELLIIDFLNQYVDMDLVFRVDRNDKNTYNMYFIDDRLSSDKISSFDRAYYQIMLMDIRCRVKVSNESCLTKLITLSCK